MPIEELRSQAEAAGVVIDVDRPLGRGSRSDVYVAEYRGEPAALKLLELHRFPRQADPVSIVRELRRLAELEHPHIARIHDVIETESVVAIILERCTSSLDEVGREPVAPIEAGALGLAVCAALDEAHRHGIVHRDVKPSNVLLTEALVVKLSDFGTSEVAGTPDYMAPEQAAGGLVGPFTDVFGVAAVLYELLSGWLPYPPMRSMQAVVDTRMTDPPQPLLELAPDLPQRFASVIDQGLAPKRGRQPTPRVFADELNRALTSEYGTDWWDAQRYPVIEAPPVS